MSQSLIVFSPSGDIHYQFNNKVIPFNDLIASLVNQTATEVDTNFFTCSANQKRFYCYKKNDKYAASYFDSVTTIDNEKIKQTLSDVLKTYFKLVDDLDPEGQIHVHDKLKTLIDYQFNQLTKLQQIHADDSGTSTPKAVVSSTSASKKAPASSKKKMRKWVDGEMVETTDHSALDFSTGNIDDSFQADSELLKVDVNAFKKENDLVLVNELNDIIGTSDDEDEDETDEAGTKSGFLSKFTSYFGSSINIDEVSKQFHEQLISKNVAPQTARQILDRIKNQLKGKSVTLANFKKALVDELTKTLSPNVSTDLLYDIKAKANRGRPYVISVVGVNGVGKSTNLAKLAYWFLQNDLDVLICACDTFRSGAVEQLKVHVNNLKALNANMNSNAKIDIFEKGYGGGDHVVATAKAAIQYGATEKFDVILIDTAGRTHSNAKLMAPLKKFGDAANPDKIIMVGEALVGTDSVEQATNFNNAFGNKRNLDFFIISKVDTVGDLMGTMINMVMATNVPILFMGTGQTYTDIKRLNVKTIVDNLMR
ncbi:hypothetical protein PSN45_002906 [Yamadazyma tenuis]|uniref:Signal recognition particle receptor subunit alpha homolog n=1 Tax=Candida tenuis (strain ATCC 10573 / BCRC 21748 / CBS 615 / JCM 9827 / NBRC 10315 / NRRL Y-1498 / VKM Y-70) TaxID=590646 RepID=G3AWA8_CANTC|nr:uncharacterized protein CANTEDRAFT_132751 [Yamadazyma tenuis ATCC 10573]EGV66500.1 hypothetical protein CANTEDRAFT_132751 [Yamadazyma tenuis ATCC 10573]WEJ95387.1 hypothetical protein PSN45_002906 [Yamadazyma tenuis]